jgi:transposase InsO family protein|tara:strand:- start:233 stop:1102 length:870 start_codon:yes stop_codon:yes gene_type:complete
MKYRFIADHQKSHRVGKMADLLDVSRSGYYAWQASEESTRVRRDRELAEEIELIQKQVRRVYGSPRMTQELARRGHCVGHNHVARLMRERDLGARPKKRVRVTTRARKGDQVAQNVLNRRFRVAAPDRVWISDITYVATAEGWLYVCVVLDLYARRVVGWSMSSSLGTELALQAFMMAFMRRRPPRTLLFHSDRGVQYTSHAFCRALELRGIRQSMSRKGDCYDNACAESFFKTLKTELTNRMFFRTRQEAKAAIFEYVEAFYNRVRLHSAIGYVPPCEFETTALWEAA